MAAHPPPPRRIKDSAGTPVNRQAAARHRGVEGRHTEDGDRGKGADLTQDGAALADPIRGARRGLAPGPREQAATSDAKPDALAIVDYALAHPEAGPRTIAAALRAEYGVGVTAVYGTLKRWGLETRGKRLEELRRRSGQTEPDEVERDRLLSKKRHLKAPEPGYLVGSDTGLVGRLKEAGMVHLAVAIDVHSSYGTAILAPARNGEMAAAALERLHRELSGEGVTRIGRAVTDNGTEFKGKQDHPFEALCRRLGIEHRYTKVRHAWTNGKAERFIQTLKHALEGLLRQKHYRTIEELQADLDEWLGWYNTERPHQGRYNRGRPPLQVIRESRNSRQDLKAA